MMSMTHLERVERAVGCPIADHMYLEPEAALTRSTHEPIELPSWL